MNKSEYFKNIAYEGFKPNPSISFDQWAEERHEVQGFGKFKFDYAPYARKILQLLSWNDPCQEITVIKGVQLIFTELLTIINEVTIDYYPKHVLNIFGSDAMAKDWVKLRFEPNLENNPYLVGKVREPREKSGASTINLKLGKGFAIKSVGGVSGKNFRAFDAAIVNIDDADALKHDIGGTHKKAGEGNPFKLAKDRTNGQMGQFKFFKQGSPKSQLSSLLWADFKDGDQHYFYVPCPNCNFFQVINFDRIIFEHDDDYRLTSVPYLECEMCNEHIFENKKFSMLNDGDWRPTANSSHQLKHSFHISSAYSLIGYTWENMTIDWLDACRDATRGRIKQKITFYNTKRAEPWVEKRDTIKIEHSPLYAMREDWGKTFPAEAVILTMGVDIQKMRIEATVVGNNEKEHRYFIDHRIIGGDTIIKHGQEGSPFNDLEKLILKTYENSFGGQQPIMQICIDIGYRPTQVAHFINEMKKHGKAIVGTFGSAHSRRKKKMFVGPETINEYGISMRELNVDEGKEQTFLQLQAMFSKAPGIEKMLHWGKKFCFTEAYFKGFCAEHPVEELENDELIRKWVADGPNEPWDCANYAMAAIAIFGIGGIDWQSFRNWNKNQNRLAGARKSLQVVNEGVRI